MKAASSTLRSTGAITATAQGEIDLKSTACSSAVCGINGLAYAPFLAGNIAIVMCVGDCSRLVSADTKFQARLLPPYW